MIKLKNTVGDDYKIDPDDILNLKSVLHKLGYYDVPKYGMTPYADNSLFSSLKKFQKDKKLKVDGIAKPKGETIQAINGILGSSDPLVRSPTFICPICGAPHGGVFGDVCPDCTVK